MKTITFRQLAVIKRTAQNVNPLVEKRKKALAKLEELYTELETLNTEIAGHEGGIKAMTGYTSSDLVTKVVTKLDKTDKKGNVLTKTEYIPTSILKYNEEKNVYEIEEVLEYIPEETKCENRSIEDLESELSSSLNTPY